MSVHKKFQPNRSRRLAGYGEHIYKCHVLRIIQQNLTNDSAKVNLMPVLQQILLDENFKFLRV